MPSPSIRIKLDTSKYVKPTEADIRAAKEYIIQREEYADILESRCNDLLAEAAERIVIICYRYGIEPQTFVIASSYNEEMMDEVAEVMNELETALLDIMYEYATRATNDNDRIIALVAWLATLGRGNRNLQDTLDTYMMRFMRDTEAAIAALASAGVVLADAITKVKAYMHSIYTMPEVQQTFRHATDFAAEFIRSRGVQHGTYSNASTGATALTNMARITLQMAWMRAQAMDFKDKGAAGYIQMRGSSYNCDMCDEQAGFHLGIAGIYLDPFPHPHCCCYRVPVFTLQ